MIARVGSALAGLLISSWHAAATAADCAVEAGMLAREQSELPRLEVASPADRPPYCITLETVMGFANRVRTPSPTAQVRISPRPRPIGAESGTTTRSCSAATGASGPGKLLALSGEVAARRAERIP